MSNAGRQVRRDLRGHVLQLDPADTWALLPGEQASIRIADVVATNDPDYVTIEGAWRGPEGDEEHARVEVRAGSLPSPPVVMVR